MWSGQYVQALQVHNRIHFILRFSNQWPLIIPLNKKWSATSTRGHIYSHFGDQTATRDIPKHLSCYAIADHERRRAESERSYNLFYGMDCLKLRNGHETLDWIELYIEYRHIIKTKSEKKNTCWEIQWNSRDLSCECPFVCFCCFGFSALLPHVLHACTFEL